MKTAGNHKVKHKPQIAFQANGDPLADSAKRMNLAAFDAAERWVDGAEQKGAGNTNSLERLQ